MNKKGITMNESIEIAAKLLKLPVDNLSDFSQDALNAMEAIVLMYDIKNEKNEGFIQDALRELEQIWRSETLNITMKDVSNVIGFDYSYETLCSLDEETKSHLMYAYLNDKSDVYRLFEIARKGMIRKELKNVAKLLNISPETLYEYPEEIQENLYGIYLYHYGEFDENNAAENPELMDRLKAVLSL